MGSFDWFDMLLVFGEPTQHESLDLGPLPLHTPAIHAKDVGRVCRGESRAARPSTFVEILAGRDVCPFGLAWMPDHCARVKYAETKDFYRFPLRFHGVGGTGCRGSLACSARSSRAQRRARVTRSAWVLRGVPTSGPSRPASNTLAIVGSAKMFRRTSRASRHDVGHGPTISGGSSDRISYHPARRREWFFHTYHDVIKTNRSSAF